MRDKIHWTWKRILGTIFGILGIGTLTSCYGVVEDEFEYDVYGKVLGNINGTTQPVQGIIVEIPLGSDDKHLTSTDKDGWFEIRNLYEGSYTIKFSDTDGTKNGGLFKQKTESFSLKRDKDLGEITLDLEEAE